MFSLLLAPQSDRLCCALCTFLTHWTGALGALVCPKKTTKREILITYCAKPEVKKSAGLKVRGVCPYYSTRENFDDKYLQLNFKTRLPLLLPSGEDWNALKCFFEASSSQKASNGMEIKVSESSRNIQRLLPS